MGGDSGCGLPIVLEETVVTNITVPNTTVDINMDAPINALQRGGEKGEREGGRGEKREREREEREGERGQQ